MAKKRPSPVDQLQQIKRLAVVAMFADDELLEKLVLKGGNALDLALRVTTRASLDLDFSIEQAFASAELGAIRARIEHRLQQAFTPAGYTVFDVTLAEKPEHVTPDLAEFWGGYELQFKLIHTTTFGELGGRLDDIRRNAIPVGPRNRTRFAVDISKFEYCSGKRPLTFDGYTIYVYTPEMIACEKLRAICQQAPTYAEIVKSHPAPRARDFLDIHDTIRHFNIDLTTPANRQLLVNIFAAKRVPLVLLTRIHEQREFHRQDWPAVEATVRPGVGLKPFDHYADFVIDLVRRLEPFGDV